jgi:hypothetical protein
MPTINVINALIIPMKNALNAVIMPSRNIMKALIMPTINKVESPSLPTELVHFDAVHLPTISPMPNAKSLFIKHNSQDGNVA